MGLLLALTYTVAVTPTPTTRHGGKLERHYRDWGRRRRITEEEWQQSRERGFSRKYFEELQALDAAILSAERQAAKAKQEAKRRALEEAAAAAAEALATAEQEKVEDDKLQRLTADLRTAANAKTLQASLQRAALALAVAEGIAKLEDEQDEEEAVMLLLQ